MHAEEVAIYCLAAFLNLEALPLILVIAKALRIATLGPTRMIGDPR